MFHMINLIVVASIAILTLLAYYKGSRILLATIISFYPSSMLYAALPIKEKALLLGTSGVELFYSHALILGIIFLPVFWAVFRVLGHEHLGHGPTRWINSLLIGGSVVLAALALSFHVLPAYNIFQIANSGIRNFWISDWGYFASIVVPIIAILRVTGRDKGIGGGVLKKF